MVIVACSSGCSARKEPVKETWLSMGTFATVAVPDRDRQHLKSYSSVASEVIRELESSLSIFNPDSEISRLNQSAGKFPVPIFDHTRKVLELTLRYAEISGGCFDPTTAPLTRLWGFNSETVPRDPPDENTVSSALDSVGYGNLVLSNRTAWLTRPDMRVDLGGIAKGYAVDVCYNRLMEMNVKNIMINIGGNIRCAGSGYGARTAFFTRQQARTSWKIGVRNPFERDQLIGTITLTDGMAVATSGNYERFVTIGNERYAHVVDPHTGYPVKGVAGVTVISTNAVEADAMSTALFVSGIDKSTPILSRIPSCHALFIRDEQPLCIYVSSGFEKYFTPSRAFAGAVTVLKNRK